MALSKAEGGLFGLIAHKPAHIFEPVSAALDGFGAGCIQSNCGVLLDQLTQAQVETVGPTCLLPNGIEQWRCRGF
jgi:hypothetical protein